MATNDQDKAARTLFVFRAGGRLFAVFDEEVEATAPDLTPAPLPFAPPAVLGVVSLRGRVRTVIDPLRLTDSAAQSSDSTNDDAAGDDSSVAGSSIDDSSVVRQTQPRLYVALAGDEQLALACDAAEGSFEIAPARVAPDADPHSHLRGTFERAGERVALLDPARLFDAAMRGTERRRKRS
jgi:chemotaxis signal transduction protein